MFPYFIVYDFEALLKKTGHNSSAKLVPEALRGEKLPKLQFIHEHIPLSVSIFSNVPGHNVEPIHLQTSGDSVSFAKQFLNSVREIAAHV